MEDVKAVEPVVVEVTPIADVEKDLVELAKEVKAAKAGHDSAVENLAAASAAVAKAEDAELEAKQSLITARDALSAAAALVA